MLVLRPPQQRQRLTSPPSRWNGSFQILPHHLVTEVVVLVPMALPILPSAVSERLTSLPALPPPPMLVLGLALHQLTMSVHERALRIPQRFHQSRFHHQQRTLPLRERLLLRLARPSILPSPVGDLASTIDQARLQQRLSVGRARGPVTPP